MFTLIVLLASLQALYACPYSRSLRGEGKKVLLSQSFSYNYQTLKEHQFQKFFQLQFA